MSVYLPERRLNFQLNRPEPAVLSAYVIHFSLNIRKLSEYYTEMSNECLVRGTVILIGVVK